MDIRHISLDLASFKSIRDAAERFNTECDRLDTLVLNAGTMANPPTKTEEGYEVQFGTNHIGHFLLTKLLLPKLLETVGNASPAAPTPDVRIVVLSSMGHLAAPSFDVMTSTSALLEANTWTRYGASKAANILFAAELARRYPEILSVSLHPGVVSSNLYEHTKASNPIAKFGFPLMTLSSRNVRSGALNQLWAAGVKSELLVNGAYYVPIGSHAQTRYSYDKVMAKKLWDWTEEQVVEKTDS